ncbi:MAG: hypothetical protein M1816_006179 [Peltula sp. TS41687]|nr:MAG: hypothetical protein M1816_006179 [Peltula sp. TS41687]
MGSSSSKGARTAVGAAVTRKYPSRVSPVTQPPASPARPQQDPVQSPTQQPQGKRDSAIDLDGSDPQYAASLRALGAVQLNPLSTFHHSQSQNQSQSTAPGERQFPDPASNPAIQILLARDRLAAEAEREFTEVGRKSHAGRQFLDIFTIRQVLMLRDEKMVKPEEIERRMGLRPGVVRRLGKKGIVGLAGHLGG